MGQDWILLIHQLPPRPTSLRVRVWRKLQRLGSVPIKNSVYVLPFTDSTYEDFQWLKQEIQTSGGEATVLRASAVEGATNKEIIEQFRKTRNEEYEQVKAEMDALSASLRDLNREGNMNRINTYDADLDKLHKELERVTATDYFNASNRSAALAAYERCRKTLLASQSRDEKPTKSNHGSNQQLPVSQYQGRRWVTRQNLFIDRLAAIWLIKRFIDAKARFFFIKEGESIEGGIGFDLYGGEFTHRGEDCTFETMIKEFGLADDAGLNAIAEIVHDIDLKDNKFNRSEAAGLGAIILGMVEHTKDDRKLAQQCGPIFDSLYQLLRNPEKKAKKESNARKRSSSGATKRTSRNS
jgi:hypothetical protein